MTPAARTNAKRNNMRLLMNKVLYRCELKIKYRGVDNNDLPAPGVESMSLARYLNNAVTYANQPDLTAVEKNIQSISYYEP